MNRRTLFAAFSALPFASAAQIAAAEDATPAPTRCICPTLDEREGAVIFEGSGTRLSEGFNLDEGRYRVEMEFTYPDRPGHVAVSLHFPDGDYDLVYNDSDGDTFASSLARNRTSGECFLEVDTSTTSWKVGISPL